MTSIAIIGASKDRAKYGNKAVRAYKSKGFTVYPINPKESETEGLPCFKSVLDVPQQIDIVSLYVPANIGITVVEDIVKKGMEKMYVNPGAESDELVKKLKEHNINPLMICSILAIGVNPNTS